MTIRILALLKLHANKKITIHVKHHKDATHEPTPLESTLLNPPLESLKDTSKYHLQNPTNLPNFSENTQNAKTFLHEQKPKHII